MVTTVIVKRDNNVVSTDTMFAQGFSSKMVFMYLFMRHMPACPKSNNCGQLTPTAIKR